MMTGTRLEFPLKIPFEKGMGNPPTAHGLNGASSGFTLIEITVSICIAGLLVAIATPFYLRYLERARVAVAISDMQAIEGALYNFFANNQQLPNTLAQINMATFCDPWGNPYQYLRIYGGDTKGKGAFRKDHFMVPVNTDFDLYSKGKDGASVSPFTAKSSQDDVVRAFNGGYMGKVADM
jgi:general secretion pathway protein G